MATKDLTITVTIPGKELKRLADCLAKEQIYDCFDEDVLKAADMPTIPVFSSKILSDPEFSELIEQAVTESIIEDDIMYDACVNDLSIIREAYEKCSLIYDQLRLEAKQLEEEKNKAADTKNHIAWLRTQGYTVTKNKTTDTVDDKN